MNSPFPYAPFITPKITPPAMKKDGGKCTRLIRCRLRGISGKNQRDRFCLRPYQSAPGNAGLSSGAQQDSTRARRQRDGHGPECDGDHKWSVKKVTKRITSA